MSAFTKTKSASPSSFQCGHHKDSKAHAMYTKDLELVTCEYIREGVEQTE